MISFIVPAHNEELWIGKCLRSIREAMERSSRDYEFIVVDDASTDATLEIAVQFGARTLRVAHRHISATRNAGVHLSRGDVLFFIDADTQVNCDAVGAALNALETGAAGRGRLFTFDRPLPLWLRVVFPCLVWLARRIRWTGGCFLFCTRSAYDECGGFCERLYAGEDIAFVQALKRVGRFDIPQPTIITSGRKLDVLGPWEVFPLLLALAIRGPYHCKRDGLDFLYGKRAQECRK